jgi:hypothetical protein
MARVHDSLFEVSLAAFASIGLPVTLLSSLFGSFRAVQRAPAERVGEAINYGVAVGLVPGLAIAAVVLVIGTRA